MDYWLCLLDTGPGAQSATGPAYTSSVTKINTYWPGRHSKWPQRDTKDYQKRDTETAKRHTATTETSKTITNRHKMTTKRFKTTTNLCALLLMGRWWGPLCPSIHCLIICPCWFHRVTMSVITISVKALAKHTKLSLYGLWFIVLHILRLESQNLY